MSRASKALETWAKAVGGTPNPCVALYGAGPEGETCHDCDHLHRLQWARAVFKCDLRRGPRGDLGSEGTDHRARWPACSKKEPGGPHDHYMG